MLTPFAVLLALLLGALDQTIELWATGLFLLGSALCGPSGELGRRR